MAKKIPAKSKPLHTSRSVDLNLLAAAVNFSEDSIMITTTDLDLPGPTIVYANPAFAKMTGYSVEEMIGRNPRFLQGPRTDVNELKRLRRILESGHVYYGSVYNYRKDGSEFVNEWHIEPIRDERGRVTHYLSIQRNITNRRKLEEDMERQRVELAAKNAALREILEQIEIEKKKIKDDVIRNVEEILMPAFKKLRRKASAFDKKYLDVLETNLKELSLSLGGKMVKDARLSPREMEITNLVRNGLNNKEIAQALCMSTKTVETHRSRIRRKLNIVNKGVNLSSHLKGA